MQPSKMTNDNKREFLRKMPEMVEEWESISKMVETWDEGGGKLSLSDSTANALIITLRCTANLIEELLLEGYRSVLTANFQTDPLESRFSRYRQMNGGRFLVGLREVTTTEKIIKITQILKAEMNFWELKPSNEKETEINAFKS